MYRLRTVIGSVRIVFRTLEAESSAEWLVGKDNEAMNSAFPEHKYSKVHLEVQNILTLTFKVCKAVVEHNSYGPDAVITVWSFLVPR